ncbi:hypothetical protein F4815DRAFT_477753 [Daldinia loculata]|nr:hypothetical protein F4815DRAFT_477753 [Daldinia loculata]
MCTTASWAAARKYGLLTLLLVPRGYRSAGRRGVRYILVPSRCAVRSLRHVPMRRYLAHMYLRLGGENHGRRYYIRQSV